MEPTGLALDALGDLIVALGHDVVLRRAADSGLTRTWAGATHLPPPLVEPEDAAAGVQRERRAAARPPAERVRAVLTLWEGTLHNVGATDRLAYSDTERDVRELLRLGEPALPGLQELAGRASRAAVRAGARIAIAAITGRVDEHYVRELLLGGRDEVRAGLRMIAASGSQAFRNRLGELVLRPDVGSEAAATLALCHLHGAVPLLVRAPASNSTAGHAVAELRERLARAEW